MGWFGRLHDVVCTTKEMNDIVNILCCKVSCRLVIPYDMA